MVVNVYEEFKHLLPNNLYVKSDSRDENIDVTREVIYLACWGHDLIEDTRTSYNDVKKNLDDYSTHISEIIRAVTNNCRGRDRDERMPDYVYEDIRNTPGADFVKLCDRIANVQYSKMTKSDMFEKYKKENDNFIVKIGFGDTNTHPYFDMFVYLTELFDGTK
jgi:hypothetical protein